MGDEDCGADAGECCAGCRARDVLLDVLVVEGEEGGVESVEGGVALNASLRGSCQDCSFRGRGWGKGLVRTPGHWVWNWAW